MASEQDLKKIASEQDLELEAQALELEAEAREREMQLLEGSVMNGSEDEFESGAVEPSLLQDIAVGGIQGEAAAGGAKGLTWLGGKVFPRLFSKTIPKAVSAGVGAVGGSVATAPFLENTVNSVDGKPREIPFVESAMNATGGLGGAQAGKQSAKFLENPGRFSPKDQLRLAEEIDPGGKLLTKSLQPRMGEFKDALGAPIKLKNAQVIGYLKDVLSPEDLVKKLERDLGTIEYEKVVGPGGKPMKNSKGGYITEPKGVRGQLQQQMDDVLERSFDLDYANPAIPMSVIEQRFLKIGKDLMEEATLAGKPDLVASIEREVASRISSWKKTFSPDVIEQSPDRLDVKGFADRLFQTEKPVQPELGRLENIVKVRRALDGEPNYGPSKNASEDGSISQLIAKRFADEFRELEGDRLIELARKDKGGMELYSSWLEAKNSYHTAKNLRDMAIAQGVRGLKNDTAGNAVKIPSIQRGALVKQLWDTLAPKVSSEEQFSKSQLASGLRGNPAPNVPLSKFGPLSTRARIFSNKLAGPAIGGATTNAIYSGIPTSEEVQRSGVPVITSRSGGSGQGGGGASSMLPSDLPPLPRDTSQWTNQAVIAFMAKAQQMGAQQVSTKLADSFKKAERLGDKSQMERIVADMSKLFPQFFEPGIGVNGKIFHADDQKEYMSKLESAQRQGFIGSSFLAEQRDAFLDRNDLKVRPVEGAIAKSVTSLPEALRPILPGSGARSDPY